MLCWKKASYNKKTISNNSNNSNSNVKLTSFTKKYKTNSNTLQSIRKKKQNPPITIRFKSNLQ